MKRVSGPGSLPRPCPDPGTLQFHFWLLVFETTNMFWDSFLFQPVVTYGFVLWTDCSLSFLSPPFPLSPALLKV